MSANTISNSIKESLQDILREIRDDKESNDDSGEVVE